MALLNGIYVVRQIDDKVREYVKSLNHTQWFAVLREQDRNEFLTLCGDTKTHWMSECAEVKNSSSAEVFKAMMVQLWQDKDTGENNVDNVSQKTVIFYDGTFFSLLDTYRKTTFGLGYLLDNRDYHNRLYGYSEKNPMPQRVGTLTDKKLQQWSEWLKARANTYDEKVSRDVCEIKKFLSEIRLLAEKYPHKYNRVTDERGQIIHNNLCFSYNISDGRIYKEIKIESLAPYKNGEWQDLLDVFKLMAEGKADF